jgi:FkbM family methyltransferase
MKRNGFTWSRSINAALSDREGTMPFYQVSDGSAHSLVPEVERRAKRYSGQVPVRVTRLDDLDQEGIFDVPTIDLIKIDVEGEEPRTVAGMLKTLERFQFPSVWAEVRGPQGSTRAPNTYPRVERELRNLGYRPLQWKNGTLRDVKTHDIRGREDVLFRYR